MTDGIPQNFTMKSGDSKTLEVTVRDAAGVAIPLAGTPSVEWNLARTVRSAAALTKTLGAGVTIIATNAALGEVNCGRLDIAISHTDSEALDGEFVHDCLLIDDSGARSTIFQGRANFTPNLT
jgi:hypothetical protein